MLSSQPWIFAPITHGSLGRPPRINDLRTLVSCLVLTYLAWRGQRPLVASRLPFRRLLCFPLLRLRASRHSHFRPIWPVRSGRPSRVIVGGGACGLQHLGGRRPCLRACFGAPRPGVIELLVDRGFLPAGPRLPCPPSGSWTPQPLRVRRSGCLHRPRPGCFHHAMPRQGRYLSGISSRRRCRRRIDMPMPIAYRCHPFQPGKTV